MKRLSYQLTFLNQGSLGHILPLGPQVQHVIVNS